MPAMKKPELRHPPHPAIIEEAEVLAGQHPDEVITVYGMDRTCYFASASLKEIEGYDPEEMVGHHYSEFVYWRDLPHVEIARTDAEFHDHTRLSVSIKTKSGQPLRTYNVAMRRTDPDTGRIYFLARTTPVKR